MCQEEKCSLQPRRNVCEKVTPGRSPVDKHTLDPVSFLLQQVAEHQFVGADPSLVGTWVS